MTDYLKRLGSRKSMKATEFQIHSSFFCHKNDDLINNFQRKMYICEEYRSFDVVPAYRISQKMLMYMFFTYFWQ